MERSELARLLGAAARVAEGGDVTIAELEFERFAAAFADAVAEGGQVFLADPGWGGVERAQFERLVRGPRPVAGEDGWLCLPTGGSSGQVKLARHDQDTLHAAVKGFAEHFGVERVNAVGLLPMHHVSGLMGWMRTVLTGGVYVPWDWRRLEAGEWPALTEGGAWFLSVVPTQLQRLLAEPAAVEGLRGFRAVIVGGGPVWPALWERAAALRLPLAFSYGMTETAAMVAALRPEEFLGGRGGVGLALPHARIVVEEDGVIAVEATSLFRGYYPGVRPAGRWRTDDWGEIDPDGGLRVHGRRDALIITGGKKVDPTEVETALRGTGFFADVAVVGVPDTEWGQAVTACYPAETVMPESAMLGAALEGKLAAYKRPKRYVPVSPWPRNAQGKLNRAALVISARSML